ncbi:hypothetical protein NUW58_g9326 [Xylaria curta]|uniref:Uncharacterized protein n=1 Tax=Xylaria curta TaxID=42375 RepID=A0ACC1MXM5_9PEZI|nr:hypothetical protein NUW58_g9326 [Xylaria curta]
MDIGGYALVIGGGSGIGEACALGFSKEGAAGVMVADINLGAAASVAKTCLAASVVPQFRVKSVHIDVTLEESVKCATRRMVEAFGRIDYCVNSAGVSIPPILPTASRVVLRTWYIVLTTTTSIVKIGVQKAAEIADADAAEFSRFLKVNVLGAFLVTRAVSAIMKVQEPRLAL